MTPQIPDSILLQGQEFVLVAWDGRGLFNPHDHGLKPDWSSTDCYRGYTCTYAIGDGSLRLRNVLFHNLGVSGPREVPPLFGKEGTWNNGFVSYSFPNLEAKIRFEGALLAGGGWTKDEFECIHPAEAFLRVYELTFEDGGRLSGLFDRAEDARALEELPRSWGLKDSHLLKAWEKPRFRGTYV
jgi:hypothetical protein